VEHYQEIEALLNELVNKLSISGSRSWILQLGKKEIEDAKENFFK
jgi:hypothetical protein